MNKMKLNKTTVSKGQLKFIIATDIFIFATIAMIIFEMQREVFKFSYLMLGIIFLLMSINQYIYYKNNNKGKRFLIMMIIYGALSLIITAYAIVRLFS